MGDESHMYVATEKISVQPDQDTDIVIEEGQTVGWDAERGFLLVYDGKHEGQWHVPKVASAIEAGWLVVKTEDE